MTEEIKDEKAVLAALERAKDDAKKYREQLEALTTERDTLKGELDTIKASAKDSALQRALEAEGVDPKRVMKFMDTDAIEYDGTELKNFKESFTTLKNDLPELFDTKRRVGGALELETANPAKTTTSTSEAQAARLLRTI